MATEAERISRLEGAYAHLATKSDVVNLKADMQADMANLKTDMANLKADIRGDLNRMFMGFTTLMLIGLGAVATIMQFLD